MGQWRQGGPWGLLGVVVLGVSGCSLPAVSGWGSSRLPRVSAATYLTAETLGLIVNQRDPLSLEIGEYYRVRRGIPPENVIRVEFDPNQTVLPVETFQTLWATVQAQTPKGVRAYALTWAQPYRVGCMSITAAFTFGFDEAFCAEGCTTTAPSPFFNSDRPLTAVVDPRPTAGDRPPLRPTMALAATDYGTARELIERGIAADYSHPDGKAYLLSTQDSARNVRAAFFPEIQAKLDPYFDIQVIEDNQISGRFDVMFYSTGLAKVPAIEANQYRPGAIADHLTSLGGQLTDSPQMSSLRWLEAGATGSYGTVVEPCNFPQKFPHPGVLMAHYLNGDTLLEAYWKSVLMPGQGIFIGEPLARPFGHP